MRERIWHSYHPWRFPVNLWNQTSFETRQQYQCWACHSAMAHTRTRDDQVRTEQNALIQKAGLRSLSCSTGSIADVQIEIYVLWHRTGTYLVIQILGRGGREGVLRIKWQQHARISSVWFIHGPPTYTNSNRTKLDETYSLGPKI
jgi:hypothetical protein